MSFELSYPIQENGINPQDSPNIYWLARLITPFVKVKEYTDKYLGYDKENRKKTVTSEDIYYHLQLNSGDDYPRSAKFKGYNSKKGMVITYMDETCGGVILKMIQITTEIQKQNPAFKLYVVKSAIPTYWANNKEQTIEECNKVTEMGNFRPSYNKMFGLNNLVVWVPKKKSESDNSSTPRIAMENKHADFDDVYGDSYKNETNDMVYYRGGKRKTKRRKHKGKYTKKYGKESKKSRKSKKSKK